MRDCFGQTSLHHAARFGNLRDDGGIRAILNSSSQQISQLRAKWTKLHVEATAKYADCLKDIENNYAGSFPSKMSSYSWMHDAKFREVIAQGTNYFVGQKVAFKNNTSMKNHTKPICELRAACKSRQSHSEQV